jgi:signal peptidase I
MSMRRLRGLLAWALFVLAATGWFIYLRPPVLGGSTAYVFVRGTSMEPKYHTGDLVLVRKQPRYRVGDIAAFAVQGGGGGQSVVIHRVIAAKPDGSYVLQGDNRDEPDPWHPTVDQIVGTPILLVPAAGRWLAEIAARPLLLGLLCGALTAVVLLFGGGREAKRAEAEAKAGPPRRARRRTRRPVPALLLTVVAAHESVLQARSVATPR